MNTTIFLAIALVAASIGITIGFYIERPLVYALDAYEKNTAVFTVPREPSFVELHGIVGQVDPENDTIVFDAASPYDATLMPILLTASGTGALSVGTPLELSISRQSGTLQVSWYRVAIN